MLLIKNEGPEIVGTNFWKTEHAKAGMFHLSTNAGTIRLLIPTQWEDRFLPEIIECDYVIVSVGQCSYGRNTMCVEMIFERSDKDPLYLILESDQCSMVPGDPSPGEWKFSAWHLNPNNGEAEKISEKEAKWRAVAEIPCLQKWE